MIPDRDELRELVADVLDVDATAVGDTTDFVSDLHVDSLIALEVTVALEKRYRIRIAEEEVVGLTTLVAVHRLVAGKLAGAAS